MPKDKLQIMSILLKCILILLIIGTSSTVYQYYKGPNIVVSRYIEKILKEDYNRACHFLNENTIDLLDSEEDLTSYYKRLYSQKLIGIKNIGIVKTTQEEETGEVIAYTYKLQYEYKSKIERKDLTLHKDNGKWKIDFPFEASKIVIEAPTHAKVYLNGKGVAARSNTIYEKDGVLPGVYVVDIILPKDYKTYHKVIEVPYKARIKLPYDMAILKIESLEGLRVSLDEYSQMITEGETCFEGLLYSDYTLKVEDPIGVLETIETPLSIQNKEVDLSFLEFKLSELGEKKMEHFIKAFYTSYLKGIKAHNTDLIAEYLDETKKDEILALYNSWFIQSKDIQDAKMSVELQNVYINKDGYLDMELMETVYLINAGEAEEEQYQVFLKWHTEIDIRQEKWQVRSREITESMVAYKDAEERWVEY